MLRSRLMTSRKTLSSKKIQNNAGFIHMKNIDMTVAGDKLAIIVDLSLRFGKSTSVKSTIIASTKVNIYKKSKQISFD